MHALSTRNDYGVQGKRSPKGLCRYKNTYILLQMSFVSVIIGIGIDIIVTASDISVSETLLFVYVCCICNIAVNACVFHL